MIKDQLNKGAVESVDDNSTQEKLKNYIPHHAVVTTNKKATKLQIMHDACAKTKKSNVSVNECLYRGLVILEDLSALLIKFQSRKVALVNDIEKYFFKLVCKKKTGMLQDFYD